MLVSSKKIFHPENIENRDSQLSVRGRLIKGGSDWNDPQICFKIRLKILFFLPEVVFRKLQNTSSRLNMIYEGLPLENIKKPALPKFFCDKKDNK